MTGIIFILNLEYAPFLKKYTTELESKGEQYEIIFWERLESDYSVPMNSIVYRKRGNLGDGKLKKLLSFLGYRRFLLKILKKHKYDKLIILTTLAGMLVGDFLIKHYKDKFILDIRDYTFERNPLFRVLEDKIIKASNFTAISSDGFKEFLPESGKYVLSHNILLEEVNTADDFQPVQNKDKINISFIGAVRHYGINKRFVDLFGNDSRYRLFFHGYGVAYEALSKYCAEKFNNVYLTGKYDRKDKTMLLSNASVINSYYGSDSYANRYALPNKYYDALIYKIPLWANPNVYVGKRAVERGVGIDLILDDQAPDKLFSTLKNFQWDSFAVSCSKELAIILEEDGIFVNKVRRFILMV